MFCDGCWAGKHQNGLPIVNNFNLKGHAQQEKPPLEPESYLLCRFSISILIVTRVYY
jgi:hypothetical protein